MKPKSSPDSPTGDLFRHRLENLIDLRHELAVLAGSIDWKLFDQQWGNAFGEVGRPAAPTRLIAGLHYLKRSHDLSDEQVVKQWLENPYWQYFCGEVYFQHKLPVSPSSLSRWRKRLGPEGMELILQAMLDPTLDAEVMKRQMKHQGGVWAKLKAIFGRVG